MGGFNAVDVSLLMSQACRIHNNPVQFRFALPRFFYHSSSMLAYQIPRLLKFSSKSSAAKKTYNLIVSLFDGAADKRCEMEIAESHPSVARGTFQFQF